MLERFFYFDLGNVLVKFDHGLAVSQVAELVGCSLEASQHALFDSGLQQAYETGLITSQQFADRVNSLLGSRSQESDVLEAFSAIFTPNDEIIGALEHVQSTGTRIGLLSNTCEAHWQWLQRQPWPMLHGWFDPLVLSYEVRSMKPTRAIYEHCEKACGCRGAGIFFTDDRADNLAAAKQMGWETYQYGTAAELVQHFDAWRLG